MNYCEVSPSDDAAESDTDREHSSSSEDISEMPAAESSDDEGDEISILSDGIRARPRRAAAQRQRHCKESAINRTGALRRFQWK